jgi:hypothetical protein
LFRLTDLKKPFPRGIRNAMNRKTAVFLGVCLVSCLTAFSCATPGGGNASAPEAPVPVQAGPAIPEGVPLDEALSGIAAYYVENLSGGTKIALVNFEAEAPLLSEYIFEELWIQFEDSRSFVLVDRHNLELIQKELEYQYSGEVSDESTQSIGKQFGPQTLVYGKITRLGGEYRLVVHATDVERAVTSIRAAVVVPDRRLAALLEMPSGGVAGVSMAGVLYSGAGNPWRFTVETDRSDGDYREGDYMTLRIYSEKDAYFKITHIDVNGNAQVIYPVSPQDNNIIKAGEIRRSPDNTRFRMTKPYGEEMILVGAYEGPFVIQPDEAAPLSNRLLARGIVVEREDTRTDMRPAAVAKFTYRIGP